MPLRLYKGLWGNIIFNSVGLVKTAITNLVKLKLQKNKKIIAATQES